MSQKSDNDIRVKVSPQNLSTIANAAKEIDVKAIELIEALIRGFAREYRKANPMKRRNNGNFIYSDVNKV